MTQRIDPTQWFTRRQSDARYQSRVQSPPPPTGLTYVGTGLFQNPIDPSQAAYIDATLTDPATPAWGNPLSGQFVDSYEFHCVANGQTVVITLPWNNTNSYRIQPLIPGYSTVITVKTVDYLGDIGTVASNSITHTTANDTTPPTAHPITATDNFPNGALITFTALNTEADFDHYLLIRTDSLFNPTIVANLRLADLPTGIFLDQAIPVDDTYTYQISAIDVSGNAASSAATSPIALKSTSHVGPAQPDLVGPPLATCTQAADGGLILTFKANETSTSRNLAGYKIYRRRTTETSWMLLDVVLANPEPTGAGKTVTYIDGRTTQGVVYNYTISAFDIYGIESTSDTSNYIVGTAADTFVPGPPAGSLHLAGERGGVKATWAASPSPKVSLYAISYRFAQLGSVLVTTFSDELVISGTSYDLTGLIDPIARVSPAREALANQFEVRVRSLDSDGVYSAYISSIISFPELIGYVPSDDSIPPAPLTVSSTINNDGSIDLQWIIPAVPDVYGYQVEQLDNETSPWRVIASIHDETVGTKHLLVTGLEPFKFQGKTYRFRVRTEDTSRNLSNPNILNNSGFESGALSPWVSGDGSATIVGSPAHNNSSFAASASSLGQLGYVATATAGLNYTISAFARKNTSNIARIILVWLNNSLGTISTVVGSNVPLTLNYQQISLTALAPVNTAFVKVILDGDAGNLTNLVYWDDAQLEEFPRATTYADGKTDILHAVDTSGPPDYALGISATGILGGISVRWTNPGSSAKDYINSTFEIWRNSGSGFVKINSVPGNNDGLANGYDDLDPLENTAVTWSYKLKARDRFGNLGPFLNGGTAVTATSKTNNDFGVSFQDGLVPTVPSVSSIIANTDGTVTLVWTESTTGTRNDLAGYTIWRKKSTDSTLLPIYTVKSKFGAGTVTFVDQALDVGSIYNYEVSAFDTQAEESAKSTTGSVITPVDNRVPAAPTAVHGTGCTGGLVVSWIASTTPGITQYRVSVPAVAGQGSQQYIVTGTSSVVILLGGPDAATARVLAITVEAVSRSGGAFSSTATMANIAANNMYNYLPVDTIAPFGITIVGNSFGSPSYSTYTRTAGVVSMVVPYDPALVVGDSIVLSSNVGGPNTPDGTYILDTYTGSGPWTLGWVDDPAKANASFTFGGPATINVVGTFRAPSNANGSIVLQWGAALATDTRGYVVEVSQETGQLTGIGSSFYQEAVVFAPTTSVRISGLTPSVITGKRYMFRVRVFDNANNFSGYTTSAWMRIANDAGTATTPTGLSLTTALDDDTHTITAIINATWDRVDDNNLASYILDYRRTDGVGGTTSVNVAPNLRAVTIHALKVAKQYAVSIRSKNTFNVTSAASSEVLITTPTPPGSNTTPGAPGLSSVTRSDNPTTSDVTVNMTVGYGGSSSDGGSHLADGDLSYISVHRSTDGSEGPQVGTVAVGASDALGHSYSFVETLARASDGSNYTVYYTLRMVDTSALISAASSQSSTVIPGYVAGGGGGGGGGDDTCPTLDMYVKPGLRVGALKKGDLLTTLEGVLTESPILEMRKARSECVRLVTSNGCTKDVSVSTPVILQDGKQVLAPYMLGRKIATLKASWWRRLLGLPGKLAWVEVTRVEELGYRDVMLINLGGKVFAGGKSPSKMIFTHNNLPAKY